MKSERVKEALLLTLTSCLFVIAGSDLASDRASLLLLRSRVGGRTLLWNTTQTSPCSWTGVLCNNGRVTVLRLPAMGLTGSLPTGLGNLTELQTLSLRFNALTGGIPSDFANLKSLRNLYLQGNFFSGEVPDSVFALQNLVRLNLGSNNFSGEVSTKFNSLTRLATLYLQRNGFTGSVPDLSVPPLQQFNVSFNRLTGSIPERFSRLDQSAFVGNSLCGKPLQPCPGSGKKDNNLSGGAIAGIVIGCVLGVLLILVLLLFLCRKRSRKSDSSMQTKRVVESEVSREKSRGDRGGGSGGGNGGNSASAVAGSVEKSEVKGGGDKSLVFFGNVNRVFSLDELLRASAEVLGKGTFGTTYKATLEMGTSVAVKRLKDVTATEREFREKIEQVGKLVHQNLVPLRGYYFSRDEKLIVYDYMPMGSLSALLHANGGVGRTPLNWETRSAIVLGAARGIAYLHSHGPTSSHGNIKSSNILLTKSFEARVSDFGLAYLALPTSTPNRVSGYRAPEVTDARKVSQKADVYSFGIMLLELLTGKAPTHSSLNEEGVDLPRWVQSVVQDEWNTEVFDMELLRYQNVEEEMVKLLQLALECTAQYPDQRPSMDVVAGKIEEICHPSVVIEEGKNNDFKDADMGFSQQYYSVDSGASHA
ncbi:probable inactive receptor kinase At1g48480 isoform X1 [Abrus precatorius]|uniref:Probable inactive receptor kinase At1g48480 isoform X1 n=1 Tax=Abrus precatorius TaxID=3816 RepID=A0A8B8JFC0_ABRPR|nr:probable inactive receptor kinase At1g48480 isoform X1 [Abrus precatorius]